MGKGEQVPEVHFSPDVHKKLRKILGNGDGPAAIIRRLEEVAAVARILPVANVKAARQQLKIQREAAHATGYALDRRSNLVDNLLIVELTLRGRDARGAAKFLAALRAELAELEDAITAIDTRTGRRRGGRPAESAARWLADETKRVLSEAGIRVTHQLGGTLFRILEILCPPSLGHEAPLDLRPWFKTLKSRR